MRVWRNWQTRRSQKPNVVGSTPTTRTIFLGISMITKIVTITCKKDLALMLRQAESIQKFIESCDHLVIIDDPTFNKKFWMNCLNKYYNNHNIIIKSYNDDVKTHHRGWIRQQAFKLLASLDCEDEYLVLDSKDFFIRPCKLSDWNGFTGSNCFENLFDGHSTSKKWMLKHSIAHSLYFDTDLLTKVFSPITPYVINTKYINKNHIRNHVAEFLNFFNYDACEFIFYNYMARDLMKNFKEHEFKSVRMWLNPEYINDLDSYIKKVVSRATKDKNIIIASIHRDVIKTLDKEQKDHLNNWIKSVGLATEI